MKYDIWHDAEEKLQALYGDEIPLPVTARYQREKKRMQNTDLEMLLAFLRHLARRFRELRATFTLRGRTGASFVCWLLEITDVNPLPAHYYCPHCKHIKFSNEEKYGWDLPEKTCSCGANMRRDGMNMVFLPEIDLPDSVHMDLDIPGELQDDVQKELLAFYPDQRFYRRETVKNDMVRYSFLLKTEGPEANQQERIIGKPTGNVQMFIDIYPHFFFLNARKNALLWELCRKTGVEPDQIPCLSPELLRAYFEYKLPGDFYGSDREKAALIKEIQPEKFSELLPLLGLGHANMEGQEQIKAQIQSNHQVLYDYDFFFEDIYDSVLSFLRAKGVFNDDLAVQAASLAKSGRFLRRGFSEGIQIDLIKHGVPESYIAYLKKIRYVYPKAHMLTNILRNLRLAWFFINHSSLWDEMSGKYFIKEC